MSADLIKHLGWYQSKLRKSQPLSRQAEQELAKKIQGSRGADLVSINKLVEANLKFAFSVALRFQGRGIPLDELIGLANLGLTIAARSFKPGRAKFISFAVNWIKQPILLALQKKRLVEVPSNRYHDINQVIQCEEALLKNQGRFPNPLDLQEELGISAREYGDIKSWTDVEMSLDATFDEEDDSGNLLDEIAAEQEWPDQELAKNEVTSLVNKIVDKLKEREGEVLKMWWGLGGQEPHRLEDIGQRLGITRERCRQIRNQAQEKFKRYLENWLRNNQGVTYQDLLEAFIK